MDKKQFIMLLGSVFVAVIFVSSFLSFSAPNTGSGQPANTSATKKAVSNVLYATARLSVNITGYANTLSITALCGNATNATITDITALLQKMENNNSVYNYISESDSNLFVEAGNLSSYGIYQFISKQVSNSCVAFSSSAVIDLPATAKFYVPSAARNVTINIPVSKRSYSVHETFSSNIINSVNVTASALIFSNGTIYGNLSIVAR